MEKIININYLGTVIPMDESAHQRLMQYEQDLKNYLSKEEDADEVFRDLQTRMHEILSTKLQNQSFISNNDINDLIAIIGNPQELNGVPADDTTAHTKTNFTEPPTETKLRRNKSDRMILGTASGVANYLGMDPVGIRLLIVTFTLINPLMGVLFYALSAIIPSDTLLMNVSRKFFRNPNDKVLGGICGGLGAFFNKESWIFRLLFLLPLLVSVFGHNMIDGWLGGSLAGSVIVTYLILWIITPKLKTSGDLQLLKGQAINLSNYNDPALQALPAKANNSGLNSFFRVLAFLFIGFCLMIFIPIAFAFIIGGIAIHKLAALVLGTVFMKMLFWCSLVLFFALPIFAVIIFLIRKLSGAKKNPRLRMAFGALFVLGFVATMLLVFNLTKEMNTLREVKSTMPLTVTGDTLFVRGMNEKDTNTQSNVIFSFNNVDDLIVEKESGMAVRALRVETVPTDDSNFTVSVVKYSLGKNAVASEKNAEQINFTPFFDGRNTLYLPTELILKRGTNYRGQNVKVVVHVPRNKKLYKSPEIRNLWDINIGVNANRYDRRHGSYYYADTEEDYEDSMIQLEIKQNRKEQIRDKEEALKDIKSNLEEMEQELQNTKKEMEKAARELEESLNDTLIVH